jgi:hypothetical protein
MTITIEMTTGNKQMVMRQANGFMVELQAFPMIRAGQSLDGGRSPGPPWRFRPSCVSLLRTDTPIETPYVFGVVVTAVVSVAGAAGLAAPFA